jgi:hypothetical protein
MYRFPYLGPSVLAAAVALASAGCGGKPTAAGISDIGREELTDIWEMYEAYTKSSGKPPASANDLKTQARGSPLGGRPLSDPNYVVNYGTPIGGSNVLAYRKDAPTQGGMVLLTDGTIKTMTAADFQAAPKAGK